MNLTQSLVTQRNVDALSRQFGLTEEQTLEAMGAVIPAFSAALKRNAGSPQGAASLIQALAGGHHMAYAREPERAAQPAGIADGNAILGHLFGNKDVSRGVATHAAEASGVGAGLIKQMLPVIASMIMGALFKGATRGGGGGFGRSMGQAAGGGLLGSLIEGLAGGLLTGARQGARSGSRRRRRRRSGGGLEDLLGGLLGGGSERRTPDPMPRSRRGGSVRRQRRQSPGGPLGDLLGGLLGGGSANRPTPQGDPVMPPPRARRNTRRPPRPSGGGLSDIFGDMLEPGPSSSRDYQRKTGSVFDELLNS